MEESKRLRLALVNPPQPYLLEPHAQVPLGLLYLSAVVKRDCPDVDVQLVDCSALSVEECVESLGGPCGWAFDVIGFTATSLDYHSAYAVTDGMNGSPMPLFIIGGPHATVMPDEVQADGWDCVFVGEAEDTLRDSLRGMKPWSALPYSRCVGGNSVDMNALPRPDRDAFPWLGGRVLTAEHKRSINIMASRGCPHNCSFCGSRAIWGRKVRWRTPEDVVDEIRECVEKYDVKVFRFSDDEMGANRRWQEKFCKLVTPLRIRWRLSDRVDVATLPVLQMMAEAGCAEINFGVESFDPQVLKMLNKGIKPEDSIAAVHNAHAAGIGVRVLMMIGTPGETHKHTVDLNIAGLQELKGHFVYVTVTVFRPFPGTPIWDKPRKYGIKIINKDFSKYNLCAYRRVADGTQQRVLWSPIRIDGMTDDQQRENMVRMMDYIQTTGRSRGEKK